MKSLNRKGLLSGVAALMLFSASSHAEVQSNNSSIIANDYFNDYMFIAAHFTSEGKIKSSQTSLELRYMSERPLLPSTPTEKVIHRTCKTQKKNELFELTAILNDKIQLLLNYFEDTPRYKIAEKEHNNNDLALNGSASVR